jgi:hypothetical protein
MAFTDGNLLLQYEGRIIISIARFFASIILHMALMDDFKLSLDLMKFILNHPYKFEKPGSALAACFFKLNSIFFTEIICIMVVSISIAPMAIVFNFLSLGIIADF